MQKHYSPWRVYIVCADVPLAVATNLFLLFDLFMIIIPKVHHKLESSVWREKLAPQKMLQAKLDISEADSSGSRGKYREVWAVSLWCEHLGISPVGFFPLPAYEVSFGKGFKWRWWLQSCSICCKSYSAVPAFGDKRRIFPAAGSFCTHTVTSGVRLGLWLSEIAFLISFFKSGHHWLYFSISSEALLSHGC